MLSLRVVIYNVDTISKSGAFSRFIAFGADAQAYLRSG